MKIKRFTAKDMRDAIRQVREEQGPDAVILSNRRVKEGVEVIAATDYDAALVQQAMSTLPKARVPKQPEAAARTAPSRAEAPQPSAGPNTRTAKPAPTNAKQPARPLLNSVAQHRETLQPATIKRAQPKRAQAIPLVDPEMAEVRRELMGVRTLLKMQLKREPSSEDARQVWVTITPAGRELVAETRRLRNAWFHEQLEALTSTERRALEAVRPILRRLASS